MEQLEEHRGIYVIRIESQGICSRKVRKLFSNTFDEKRRYMNNVDDKPRSWGLQKIDK